MAAAAHRDPGSRSRLGNLDAHALLIRRVTEILDSQLVLLGYLPAELPRAALTAAELAGLRGPTASAAAQAACLEMARRARLRGDPPSTDPPEQPLTDLRAGRDDLRAPSAS